MGTKIIPISDLRRKAKDVIDAVQEQQDAVYITQHGRPAVVLVGYERYEQLLGQIEELSGRLTHAAETAKNDAMLREQPQPYALGKHARVSLGATLSMAQRLSPVEKAQLIEQLVPDLQSALQNAPPTPRNSLRGLWRGVDITDQDITEARREMWGNFPREDI